MSVMDTTTYQLLCQKTWAPSYSASPPTLPHQFNSKPSGSASKKCLKLVNFCGHQPTPSPPCLSGLLQNFLSGQWAFSCHPLIPHRETKVIF